MDIRDLVIVGAGPAGLTAGLYAARARLDTLLLERLSPGGQVLNTHWVENWPGDVAGVSGFDLADRFRDHALKFGLQVKSSEVRGLSLDGGLKVLDTDYGPLGAKALILATGASPRKLGVPGEAEFLGRGVSYCAVCDGPLFRGKTVAVIGSGNEALQDALHLSSICGRVHLITHTGEVTAEKALADECAEKPNIRISRGRARSVLGDDTVKSIAVLYPEDNREVQIPIDGVFISIGEVPVTNLVRKAGVAVDERGCIKVDRRQATNVDGVYAAGDCTCGGMQIVTAVGEGAMAAMQAYRYVRKVKP